MQQVERCRDEREREQGEAEHAQSHVGDEPEVAARRRLGHRREAQQQRQADQAGRQGRREQRHGGGPQHAFTDDLQEHDEKRQQGEREREPDRRELREAGDVKRGPGARYGEQESPRRGPPSRERRQRERGRDAVQRQRDEMEVIRHGSATRGPIRRPANDQEGIFLTRRTGMPGATSGFATPITSPDDECSRV